MATYQEHINKANSNLTFLSSINATANDFWDWQVTVSFYVGVHLVNAHIAQKSNMHYRSHEQVSQAINPYNKLSLTKLPEDVYLSYAKLQGLARRARYLCHEEPSKTTGAALFTYDKHFARAVRYLDHVMQYFSTEYKTSFGKMPLQCVELKNKPLQYFSYAEGVPS